MPANVDGMVREGISAYRAGRKDEARALLMRAVEIDQYNEQAWLWLSAVVESVDEQRTCLENVLTINPGNERAKQGLEVLSQKAGPAAGTKTTQADDVLASASFTTRVDDDDDEMPDSINFEPAAPTATSSASASHRVNEPSPAEYDDWVSNLNLGGTSKATTLEAAEQFIAAQPVDDDEDDDPFNLGGRDDDDDLFSSGPFSTAEPPRTEVATFAGRELSPAKTTPPPKPDDRLLDEIIEEDDDEFGDVFDEFEDDELDKLDASEFFQYIPKEIKPTRMPGTVERYPLLVIVGLLVTVLLNVGAVALLVINLTAR